MNNVMLSDLPDEWKGYQIEADFRIGLQISQLLYDSDYTEFERITGCIDLLYYDIPESVEEAMQGITWFLNGWNHDNFEKGDNVRCVDFDMDQWRIYSAFLNQYHINLSEADMHWWKFMGLLTALNECAYTQVVGIRSEKINPKLSQKEKEAKKKAKRIYAIQNGDDQDEMSTEEKARYDEFMKFAKINKANSEPG
ncbi:Gp15 family bacteriophage protein [Kineothrix sp. MB12-C1]|uniref:Gp15 family bacteriophage protein n=1 Tax=Kineothrix sp. MB12-C1 TaxID=3070215 RepID=UPI0027D31B42|nr:Gp15 family bacteriophage protein [Kineothrix sp. MB12-C1]WMC91262.1 Gp15 family bacteriophage protein [Kineothrix sp. MB12-C1]